MAPGPCRKAQTGPWDKADLFSAPTPLASSLPFHPSRPVPSRPVPSPPVLSPPLLSGSFLPLAAGPQADLARPLHALHWFSVPLRILFNSLSLSLSLSLSVILCLFGCLSVCLSLSISQCDSLRVSLIFFLLSLSLSDPPPLSLSPSLPPLLISPPWTLHLVSDELVVLLSLRV